MRRLMRAHVSRLWKNGPFRLGAAGMALISILNVVQLAFEVRKYADMNGFIDEAVFGFAPLMGLFIGAVVSMFLSVEFSDGGLRNKLIVRHRRGSAYLAALLGSALAAALMVAVTLLAGVALGLALLDGFELPVAGLAALMLNCVFSAVALSAIFTAIAMNVPNRAASVILCVTVAILLLWVASYAGGVLDEPEMMENYLIINADGVPEKMENLPNPRYVQGTVRKVYEFIYDLLPTGQGLQIANCEGDRIARWPILSALVALLGGVAGYIPFRRRDIR